MFVCMLAVTVVTVVAGQGSKGPEAGKIPNNGGKMPDSEEFDLEGEMQDGFDDMEIGPDDKNPFLEMFRKHKCPPVSI